MIENRTIIKEEIQPANDGKNVTHLVIKSPIHDESTEEVVGMLAVSIDISSRKKLEHELDLKRRQAESANLAKTEFIANMSHDIRTPLSGVMGILEILYERMENTSVEKGLIKDGLEAIMGLMRLVNEIIELTRYEFGFRPEIEDEGFYLKSDILDEIYALYLPTSKEKKLNFQIEISDNIPEILKGNRLFIHRILLNLVSNAIKFTDSGSVIISCSVVDEDGDNLTLKIVVKDTGIGIPKEKQEIIFDVFSRLTASWQGTYKGPGLGLYIVKFFLQTLNGDIQVESEEGKGSSFICKIPVKIGTLNDLSNRLLERVGKSPWSLKAGRKIMLSQEMNDTDKKIQVLLVEDDILAQKVSMLLLNKMRCGVDIAKNGEEALRKFQQRNYHLVFMDIGLPDCDGYLVAQKIRAWERQHNKPGTPIIAQTAHHVDLGVRELAVESDIDDIVPKPLDQKTIEQLLERFMPVKTINEGPIIDWELGTQVSGSREMVEEILELLANIVKEQRKEITYAFENKNWVELKYLIHKLHGGAAYCGVPRLHRACFLLEEELNLDRLTRLPQFYEILNQEMDNFLFAYQQLPR